jgi:hypothetical protein
MKRTFNPKEHMMNMKNTRTNQSKESKQISIKQIQKHDKQTQTQESNLYISQYIEHFGDDVTLHIIVSHKSSNYWD